MEVSVYMIKRDYYSLIFKYAEIISEFLNKEQVKDAQELYLRMEKSVEASSVVCLHLAPNRGTTK